MLMATLTMHLERGEPGPAARPGRRAGGGGGDRRAPARPAGSAGRVGGRQSEPRPARAAVGTAAGPARPSVRRGPVSRSLAAVPGAPGDRRQRAPWWSAAPGCRWRRRRVALSPPATPTPTLLVGERATVGAVEEAMRRVDVAHLVCHGSFSSGNPMFSSLRLADGPMFVYDLERLSPPPQRRRAVGLLGRQPRHAGRQGDPRPHRVPAGDRTTGRHRGDRRGAGCVLDRRFHGQLHRALADGIGPAEALRRARQADPIIGGAFACHGAD